MPPGSQTYIRHLWPFGCIPCQNTSSVFSSIQRWYIALCFHSFQFLFSRQLPESVSLWRHGGDIAPDKAERQIQNCSCIFSTFQYLRAFPPISIYVICTFPLFFPLWGIYKGKSVVFVLIVPYYLIKKPCWILLGFPCSMGVNIHCGTYCRVSQEFLHILRWCSVC